MSRKKSICLLLAFSCCLTCFGSVSADNVTQAQGIITVEEQQSNAINNDGKSLYSEQENEEKTLENEVTITKSEPDAAGITIDEKSDATNRSSEAEFSGEEENTVEPMSTVSLQSVSWTDYATQTADGKYVFYDEDYEMDSLPDDFDMIEYENSTPRGTMSVPTLVENPDCDSMNSSDRVLMLTGVGKTDTTRFPNNTGISFYQGAMNPKAGNMDKNYTPAALGINNKKVVYEVKAYIKSEMTRPFFILPRATRSLWHKQVMFDIGFNKSDAEKFSIYGNINGVGTRSYATYNDWHKYTAVYDTKLNTAEYYIDDKLALNGGVSGWPSSLAAGMGFYSENNLIAENLIYFDDAKLYAYTPEINIIKNDFNASTGTYTFQSETAIDVDSPYQIEYKKGEDVYNNDENGIFTETLSADKKTLTIKMSNPEINLLDGYSLKIKGIKDIYENSFSDVSCDFSLPEGGANTSFDVENKKVTLNFMTKVTTMTADNVIINRDSTIVDNGISDFVLADNGSNATFVINDVSYLASSNVHVSLEGVKDIFNQEVIIKDTGKLNAPPVEFTEAKVNSGAVKFLFTQNIGNAQRSNITVKKNGNIITNAVNDVVFSGNMISVILSGTVMDEEEYTIEINGAKDIYGSPLSAETSFVLSMDYTIYENDYDSLSGTYGTIQQYGRKHADNCTNPNSSFSCCQYIENSTDFTAGFADVVQDPTNPDNKVITIYGEGKTDERYSNATAVSLLLPQDISIIGNYIKENPSSTVIFETKLYLDGEGDSWVNDDGNSWKGGLFIGPASRAAADNTYQILFNTNIWKNTTITYKGSDDRKITLPTDKWITLKYIINFVDVGDPSQYGKKGTVSVFVDDQILHLNQGINTYGVSDFSVYCNTLIEKNQVYFDDLKVYSVLAKPGVSNSEYVMSEGKFNITFSTPVTKETVDSIGLFKGEDDCGQLIQSRSISNDGYHATILVDKSKLDLETEYKFKISSEMKDKYGIFLSKDDIYIPFRTGYTKEVYINDYSDNANLTYNSGSLENATELSYNMVISNETTETKRVKAGIGVYGDNNKLLKLQTAMIDAAPNNTENLFEINGFTGAKYIVLYLWSVDDSDEITGIIHKAIMLGDGYEFSFDEPTASVLPEFSVVISDVENNYATIFGNATENTKGQLLNVILLSGKDTPISAIDTNLISMGSVVTDETGKFSYSFEVSTGSGDYTAYVLTKDNTYSKSIQMKTLDDTAIFVRSIKNGTVLLSDIYSQTCEYAGTIGVDIKNAVKTQRDINLLNNYVDKNRASLSGASEIEIVLSYRTILKRVFRELLFLQELESCTYYGMTLAKLREYQDVNLIDFTAFDSNKYSNDNRAALGAKFIGKEFEDASKVKAYFVSELNKLNANTNQNSSSVGNGSSPSAIKMMSPESTGVSQENKVSFIDLNQVDWATYAITRLLEEKIVDGISDNQFFPLNTVTREQFVKMLVLAFDVNTIGANSDFDDVHPDDWFYSYVSAAYKAGWIGGISKTKFGTGLDIKRQDMVVIVYNALRANGYKFSGTKQQFSDEYEISDYAKEAVATLAGEEIVNGVGDNIFNPSKTVTRAEAAVLINKLLEKIK